MNGKSRILFAVFAAVGVFFMAGLGKWQLDRLKWKNDLIARISSRMTAAPISLDELENRRAAGNDIDFTPIKLEGTINPARTAFYYAKHGNQVGWFIASPMVTKTGRTIIVNRGFIPETARKKYVGTKAEKQVLTATAIVRTHQGNHSIFTPKNDPKANIWFTWSPAEMAAFLSPGTSNNAPYIAHLTTTKDKTGPQPVPLSVRTIRNNHLEYALTWFSLAALLAALTALFVLKKPKSVEQTRQNRL